MKIELKLSDKLDILLREVVSSITTNNVEYVDEMKYRKDRIHNLSSNIKTIEHAIILGNYLIYSEELYNDDISFVLDSKEYTINELYEISNKKVVTFVDKRLSIKDHYHDFILDGKKHKVHHDNFVYMFCPKKYTDMLDRYTVSGTYTVSVPINILNSFLDKDKNEFRRYLGIEKKQFSK